MFGLFKKSEERQETPVEKRQGYTDLVLEALISNATNGSGKDPLQSSAVEIASGYWSRAFASATANIEGYFNADNLAWIGRKLVRNGQATLYIDVDTQTLIPVVVTNISGNASPSSWVYEIDMVGPSGTDNRSVSGSSIIHVKYAYNEQAPWRGISPLDYAVQSGQLHGALERALEWEATAPVGYIIPVPESGTANEDNTDPSALLRQQLTNLNGRVATVETTQGGYGEGSTSRPQADWQPRRLGANPPDVLIDLRYASTSSLLAAMGVPPTLIGISSRTSTVAGSANREAWRHFLHGTIQPMSNILAQEASIKLGKEIEFNFEKLFASDIQGRARSFNSMVQGGMDLERAANLSGLISEDVD